MREEAELSLGHVKIKVLRTFWLLHVVSTSFHLSHPTTVPQQPLVHSYGLQSLCLSFRLDFTQRWSQVLLPREISLRAGPAPLIGRGVNEQKSPKLNYFILHLIA